MSEQFILQYIPQRIRELGCTQYHIDYCDKVIPAATTQEIEAHNTLYFIVDDPTGLQVSSDYGVYDLTDDPLEDNIHQHRGTITITNPGTESRRIKFVRVTIVR
jgi:hypothetical protein